MTYKYFLTLIVLVLCCSSCGIQVREVGATTPTFTIITATLPPTLTPLPSQTPLPPLSQPATAPVEGTASTQINVRSEPTTTSAVLGIIPANTKVQIVGKDLGENWWQILYPQGQDGKGWVTAKYVTTAGKPEVPMIGGRVTNPNNEHAGIIQQKLNIRSGPGTSFNSIGTLNPQDVVSLTGKDPNGAWLQIDLSAGPEGKGWVNAAFVQAQNVDMLPIITEAGTVLGTGTPTNIPPTSTMTLMPAWLDGDSAAQPIANVNFKATGTHVLIYDGDVSAPTGDTEDWIAFTSYGKNIFASISCTDNNAIKLEVLKNNVPVNNIDLVCGDTLKEISIEANAKYMFHIQAQASSNNLQYTHYTITLQTR